jgi:hypothetical protein
MSGIEDLVRRSLRDRVEAPPALGDPAGRAVSRARTVRRRQALLAVCAAGLAGVLAAAGLAALRGGVHTLPVPPATVPPTAVPSSGVSLVVDQHMLLTPDGRTVALPASEDSMVGAVQVRQGWLVTGTTTGTDTRSWWLVTPDLQVRRLLQGLTDSPVVARDGHLAWRTATRLFTGHLSDDGTVVTDRSTPMPAKGAPIALAGNAVVLGATATGGGIDSHDLWLPEHGDYVPTWTAMTHIASVYAPTGDGRSLLGLVYSVAGSKETCLAELDPANNLRATRSACGLSLRDDWPAAVSPDGRWLAAHVVDGVALIDLSTVFQRPAVTATWQADAPGVWVDATTMVAPVSGHLRRFHVAGGSTDPVTVPGLPSGTGFDLVPLR